MSENNPEFSADGSGKKGVNYKRKPTVLNKPMLKFSYRDGVHPSETPNIFLFKSIAGMDG